MRIPSRLARACPELAARDPREVGELAVELRSGPRSESRFDAGLQLVECEAARGGMLAKQRRGLLALAVGDPDVRA
jgi:hypothetical protein